MAEVWVAAAATVVVGAYSADQQKKASKNAANAAAGAAAASDAESARQYDQTRQDQLPFLEAGYDALRLQNEALKGDFSGFQNAPDYAYARDQSLRALDRGAIGNMFGGGHDADRMNLASGLASQNFNNYWNRLAGRAGQAQTAATNLGQLGMGMTNKYGQNQWAAANARGTAYQNAANANAQMAAGIGGAFNNWYQNNSARNNGGTGWYLGNNPGPG